MKHLEVLDLSRTNVNDDGLKFLPELKTLKHLYLKHEEYITNKGLSNLIGLEKLDELNLSKSYFLNRLGMAYLAKLPALTKLRLDSSGIKDDDLVEVPKFKNLSVLAMRRTKITDQGVIHLLNTRIEKLDLGDTKISDKSLRTLAKLKSLKKLGLYDCKISPGGLEELLKKRSDINVYFKTPAPFNSDRDNR